MCKVMIVDDSMFMRKMLKTMVTEAGYSVVAEARNGLEAIRLCDVHSPNIVTLDITMPKMGGIEALRTIIRLHPNTSILMVSAMGQKKIIREAIEAGASGFLVKPFSRGQVLREISFCLKR